MRLGKLRVYFETSPAPRLLRSPNAPSIIDWLDRQFKQAKRIVVAHSDLLAALAEYQEDGVDEVRYVRDGNNVLLETDGMGTGEAEFTYIPQAYAPVINVAIIAPRDEPGRSNVMMTRPIANLASRR